MFQPQLKLSSIAVSFLLLFSLITFHAAAQAVKQTTESSSVEQTQSAPGQPDKIPQPGELGSPFSANHFWNRMSVEFAGEYSPTGQGSGSYGAGYGGTAGAISRFNLHWDLLAEFQFLSQKQKKLPDGSASDGATSIADVDVAGLYAFMPHEATSPYILGGAGYYHMSTPTGIACVGGCSSHTSANAAGFLGGLGIRHRLYADKRMEIFAEGRYHYIASGSSAFGQISLFPISAGIRW